MISLENVTKYYPTRLGRHYVLKNVNLTLPSNKNIGILGFNGQGKSTLVRLLGGIDYPNQGKITSNKSFSWPLALSGGFQGSLTGRDNVKFVCRIYSTDENEIERKIEFIKDFSELKEYFDMPIKTYSSGMRSRLSFGLSMAFDFDYYLIDETMAVGDKKFHQKCADILKKKREYSHILLVSHNANDIKKFCDVAIVLNNGQLHYFATVDAAIKYYNSL